MNEAFNADTTLELVFSGDVDDSLYYESDILLDIDMLVNQH